MKSEKAKEFIDGCMAHLTVEMSDHAKWQLRTAMTHAVELAESEAEERMREKVIKAFCKDCPIYSIQTSNGGTCPHCDTVRSFIQKLNEV